MSHRCPSVEQIALVAGVEVFIVNGSVATKREVEGIALVTLFATMNQDNIRAYVHEFEEDAIATSSCRSIEVAAPRVVHDGRD